MSNAHCACEWRTPLGVEVAVIAAHFRAHGGGVSEVAVVCKSHAAWIVVVEGLSLGSGGLDAARLSACCTWAAH
jgi:hypothetical protein